jgi:hypothetical protein
MPFAPTAATILGNGLISRWDGPDYRTNKCMLVTSDDRAITLRWIAGESVIERTTFSMFSKDDKGNLRREPPSEAYDPVVRFEGVTKVTPVKVAESGGVSVWGYREANAIVLVVPGKGGTIARTGSGRRVPDGHDGPRTKPASECKTTALRPDGEGHAARTRRRPASAGRGLGDRAPRASEGDIHRLRAGTQSHGRLRRTLRCRRIDLHVFRDAARAAIGSCTRRLREPLLDAPAALLAAALFVERALPFLFERRAGRSSPSSIGEPHVLHSRAAALGLTSAVLGSASRLFDAELRARDSRLKMSALVPFTNRSVTTPGAVPERGMTQTVRFLGARSSDDCRDEDDGERASRLSRASTTTASSTFRCAPEQIALSRTRGTRLPIISKLGLRVSSIFHLSSLIAVAASTCSDEC